MSTNTPVDALTFLLLLSCSGRTLAGNAAREKRP